jgi:hypothetical protein
MILAAVRYAEGKGPPPPELELALACQRWGTLPRAGGLIDQRAGEVHCMAIALDAFRAWQMWMTRMVGDEGNWAKAHPYEWRWIEIVRGLDYG